MHLNNFPCDRQLDMMDCGPACLKMIAKHYGKFYSLQYLRDKCGITKEGVSFLDLSHAAEDIGLRTLSLKCSMEDLLYKIPLPAIIHWDTNHFVVVYKTTPKSSHKNKNLAARGTIYVSDPAKGHIKYTAEEFAAKWLKHNPSEEKEGENKSKLGILMAIEPQADFYNREADEKLERKKTFENFTIEILLY
jgi:ATP-binding cassette subfamily B protein